MLAPRGRFRWSGSWTNQPGFRPRRWSFGQFLPRGWFGRPFWIVDFGDYGLLPPPFGFVWVRVGTDALLVNMATGRIVEVVYGLFF